MRRKTAVCEYYNIMTSGIYLVSWESTDDSKNAKHRDQLRMRILTGRRGKLAMGEDRRTTIMGKCKGECFPLTDVTDAYHLFIFLPYNERFAPHVRNVMSQLRA